MTVGPGGELALNARENGYLTSMQIEQLEQWIGSEIVDPDGDKIGKLEDVYFADDKPVLGELRAGRIARKRYLVPLRGATANRDHLRVTVDDAALYQSPGEGLLTREEIQAVAAHYGPDAGLDGIQELESSHHRAERLAALEEARRHADELEAAAAQAAERAQIANQQAEQADANARQAEMDRRKAEDAARAARAKVPAPTGEPVQ